VIINQTTFSIDIQNGEDFSDLTKYYPLIDVLSPYNDAVAEKHIVFENDDVRISVIGLGEKQFDRDGFTDFRGGLYCFENLSETEQEFIYCGSLINGITLNSTDEVKMPPKTKYYGDIDLYSENAATNSIEELSVAFSFGEDLRKDIVLLPVKLSQHGKSDDPVDSGIEIFNKGGIRVLLEEQTVDYFGDPEWDITIINDSDRCIQLGSLPADEDDFISDVSCYYTTTFAHSRKEGKLSLWSKETRSEIPFLLQVTDMFDSRNSIFVSDEPIILTVNTDTLTDDIQGASNE